MSSEDQVKAVIARHVTAFQRGDIDAIMADYSEDAVMVTKGTGPLAGVAAIRQAYSTIFTKVFPPQTTRITFETPIVAGEIALMHFAATTPHVRTIGAFDSFVIRGGMIVGQTGGGEFVTNQTV